VAPDAVATNLASVRFADTGVLLYALSTEPDERAKADRARRILHERDLRLSVQVLQEFYVQSTHESRPDRISDEHALALMETFLRFPVQEATAVLVLSAARTAGRYGLSYRDAAIVEAARLSGCDVVLSEEISDGADYEGVRVENPFQGL
jgi:predicted nucleic acid-binding protein